MLDAYKIDADDVTSLTSHSSLVYILVNSLFFLVSSTHHHNLFLCCVPGGPKIRHGHSFQQEEDALRTILYNRLGALLLLLRHKKSCWFVALQSSYGLLHP